MSLRTKPRANQETNLKPRREKLRRVTVWIPDVNAPGFREEARRQSLLVANSKHAREDQDFIDAISDRDCN